MVIRFDVKNPLRRCVACGEEYKAVVCGQRRCRKCIRLAKQKAREKTHCKVCGTVLKHKRAWRLCPTCKKHTMPVDPINYYVYAWFHIGDHLPFYVGKGTDNRAWRSDKPGDTTVKVYRDGLTEEGAFLIEAVLIKVFESLGAKLENRQGGKRRQEIPPLVVPETIKISS